VVIAKHKMTISVSELKARLLEIVREVEREGTVVEVERHGKVVARIVPAASHSASARPWEALLGAGTLLGDPEESVLEESDFRGHSRLE
jgi:prevent-host-death family protein